jgi:AcrR family transcriptional regulator
MPPQGFRETLIARTVRVIATEGLDKTTTKAIVTGTGINEVYIYRLFVDKEDLLSKAFAHVDEELLSCLLKGIKNTGILTNELKNDCKDFFLRVWRFLLENTDVCRTFTRYYYSPYFARYSMDEHKARYAPVISAAKNVFRSDADVWMLICHALNVMLDFAIKVIDGSFADNRETADHIFNLLYNSVKSYFSEQISFGTEVAD